MAVAGDDYVAPSRHGERADQPFGSVVVGGDGNAFPVLELLDAFRHRQAQAAAAVHQKGIGFGRRAAGETWDKKRAPATLAVI